jgi:hypothetical protein
MAERRHRPHAGLIISLPTALLLAGLFFMPWVEVSCSGNVFDVVGIQTPQPMGAELRMSKKLVHVTGWQLARGEFTPSDEAFQEMERQEPPPGQEVPRARPWVYGCLGVPILIAVVAALGLAGVLTTSSSGKFVGLLALIGLCFCIGVWSMDYLVDDIVAGVEEQMDDPGCRICPAARRKGLETTRDRLEKIIEAEYTPYFWGVFGLHGVVMICGLVASGAHEPLPARDRSDSGHTALGWRTVEARRPPEHVSRRPAPQPNFGRGPQAAPKQGAAVAPPKLIGPADRPSAEDDEPLSFGEDIN